MQSFVMNAVGETGFAEKERPEPGPNDAILEPTVALICTSDVHTVHGAIGERENLTLGHEAVGTVAEVGSAVEDFENIGEAFELMASKEDGVVKPLVRF